MYRITPSEFLRAQKREPLKGPPYELQSQVLKGDYIREYIGDYYRACNGGY